MSFLWLIYVSCVVNGPLALCQPLEMRIHVDLWNPGSWQWPFRVEEVGKALQSDIVICPGTQMRSYGVELKKQVLDDYVVLLVGYGRGPFTNKSAGMALYLRKKLFPENSLEEVNLPRKTMAGRGLSVRLRSQGFDFKVISTYFQPFAGSSKNSKVWLKGVQALLGFVKDELAQTPKRCNPIWLGGFNTFGKNNGAANDVLNDVLGHFNSQGFFSEVLWRHSTVVDKPFYDLELSYLCAVPPSIGADYYFGAIEAARAVQVDLLLDALLPIANKQAGQCKEVLKNDDYKNLKQRMKELIKSRHEQSCMGDKVEELGRKPLEQLGMFNHWLIEGDPVHSWAVGAPMALSEQLPERAAGDLKPFMAPWEQLPERDAGDVKPFMAPWLQLPERDAGDVKPFMAPWEQLSGEEEVSRGGHLRTADVFSGLPGGEVFQAAEMLQQRSYQVQNWWQDGREALVEASRAINPVAVRYCIYMSGGRSRVDASGEEPTVRSRGESR